MHGRPAATHGGATCQGIRLGQAEPAVVTARSHSLLALQVGRKADRRLCTDAFAVQSAAQAESTTAAGGTASGKTTVCDLVKQRLNDQCVVMLSQDSFYRSLTEKELENVAGELHARCRPLCVMPM